MGKAWPWLLTLVALVVSAAVWVATPDGDALSRIRHAGVIRIGYAVEAPYAFVLPDGRVTGEQPEVARLVSAHLGIRRVEWVQTSFDDLIIDLREGRFDVIGAGMFITPGRARSVAFAEPSLRVRAGLLVAKGNPKGLRSYLSVIDQPGVRIAALAGSVEEHRLLARGLAPGRLLRVPDATTGRVAVQSGAVDALALSLPTIRRMARESHGALEAVAVRGTKSSNGRDGASYVAFAVSKKHSELLLGWNKAQAAIIGSSAYFLAIQSFGFGAANLPGDVTVAEAVK